MQWWVHFKLLLLIPVLLFCCRISAETMLMWRGEDSSEGLHTPCWLISRGVMMMMMMIVGYLNIGKALDSVLSLAVCLHAGSLLTSLTLLVPRGYIRLIHKHISLLPPTPFPHTLASHLSQLCFLHIHVPNTHIFFKKPISISNACKNAFTPVEF